MKFESQFSFKKMHMKMSATYWPFCLGLNVMTVTLVKHGETGTMDFSNEKHVLKDNEKSRNLNCETEQMLNDRYHRRN